jgi:hypothetical protein
MIKDLQHPVYAQLARVYVIGEVTQVQYLELQM